MCVAFLMVCVETMGCRDEMEEESRRAFNGDNEHISVSTGLSEVCKVCGTGNDHLSG